MAETTEPRPPSFKVAFIGSHGVGKTTLCYGLAAQLKVDDIPLDVVHEVARRCPLPVNEQTGVASESWILHTQIAEEILAQARYPLVICDRSALDNYVYLLLSDGPQEGLELLVDWWMASYDLLIHVPVCDEPSADGFRSENPAFQRAIDERLVQELTRRGLTALALDPAQRSGWLECATAAVRERIAPRQLRLL
ncbi:MAG: ATP-binding protein [Acidobacteria bacterium]|nr:ATP-binding protein [Acidobacteriota bacterium]